MGSKKKQILKTAIKNGKPKAMAKQYFKKMTKTVYEMDSKQAAFRVSLSSGISIATNKSLSWGI